MPRMVLDAKLAQFAAQQPGVQLHEGFKVQSAGVDAQQAEVTGLYHGSLQKYTAKVIIGADGIRSRFHSWTVALKDAELACQILRERLPKDKLAQEDLAEYTVRRESYFRPSFDLAQILLSAVQQPFLARQAVRALFRNQSLRTKIITLAADLTRASSLTRRDQFRLLTNGNLTSYRWQLCQIEVV
ncbi:hypothetical protein MYX84_06325 [Acidobacteria bacterium AH-259-O06]|nr:hypothetical protein [Acidobacteria bacterium AH-259-O06]